MARHRLRRTRTRHRALAILVGTLLATGASAGAWAVWTSSIGPGQYAAASAADVNAGATPTASVTGWRAVTVSWTGATLTNGQAVTGYVVRRYDAGSVVLRDGDAGDTCYVLQRGRARVTRQHADGRTITLTNLGPGEIFGELAMFGGEVRSATVEALDDVQAVAEPVLAHRILSLSSDGFGAGGREREVIKRVLAQVPVPI